MKVGVMTSKEYFGFEFSAGIVKGMPGMILHNTLCKSVLYTCKMCKMCETSKSFFVIMF